MSPGGQDVRVDVEGRTLKLSNLDKVLYPRTGTPKGEVLNYNAQVPPVLLPLLRARVGVFAAGVPHTGSCQLPIPGSNPTMAEASRMPPRDRRNLRRSPDLHDPFYL